MAREVVWQAVEHHIGILRAEPLCVDGKGDWTGKHRDVARKIFSEGGWTQKKLFDIGGRTTVSVKLVRWRKAQKAQAPPLCAIPHSEARYPEAFRKWEKKRKHRRRMEMAKRYSRTSTQWNPVE